jgi:hypothetical protein
MRVARDPLPDGRIEQLTAHEEERFRGSHRRSAELCADAKTVMQGGVPSRSERVRNYRDYLEIDKSLAYLSWLYQCNRGVLMAPGAEENWTLSVQHTASDVQRNVDNFAEMARDLRSTGSI